MFTFNVTGSLMGYNTSRDGKVMYLKILGENLKSMSLAKDESPSVLDIQCDPRAVPAGIGPQSILAVSGVGAIAARDWTNQDTGKTKQIHNTRFIATSVKLAQ